MKLPKSFIKKFGGITKEAWAAFRKSRGVKKHKAHATGKKSGTPARSNNNSGGSKMAKKKGHKRAAVKKAYHKVRAGMDTRPGKVITMAVTAAAGGVATSFIVNKAPVIKDQGRLTKSLVQGGLGLVAILFVRNRHVKSLGAGAVIASVMGAAKEMLKVEPLAGPGGRRVLTPGEMARITGGMNMPLPQGMNAPLNTAPAGSGFNRGGFGS